MQKLGRVNCPSLCCCRYKGNLIQWKKATFFFKKTNNETRDAAQFREKSRSPCSEWPAGQLQVLYIEWITDSLNDLVSTEWGWKQHTAAGLSVLTVKCAGAVRKSIPRNPDYKMFRTQWRQRETEQDRTGSEVRDGLNSVVLSLLRVPLSHIPPVLLQTCISCPAVSPPSHDVAVQCVSKPVCRVTAPPTTSTPSNVWHSFIQCNLILEQILLITETNCGW